MCFRVSTTMAQRFPIKQTHVVLLAFFIGPVGPGSSLTTQKEKVFSQMTALWGRRRRRKALFCLLNMMHNQNAK